MLIRRAVKEDMQFIGSCHYHCWQETYRGLISDDYLNRLNEQNNIKRFEGYWNLIGGNQYIVEENNTPIGFFDISKARDHYAPFEVQGLYIRKAYHRKGYGRKIIEYIRNSINGPFYLWCLSTNLTCSFYEHMGGKMIDEKQVTIGGRLEAEICFYFENVK